MKIRQWLLVMLFSSSAAMANTDDSDRNAEVIQPNPIMAMSMAMDIEQNRAKLRFNRLQLLEQKMQLEAEQDSAFWEIYSDYVIAMEKVNDRVWNLIVQYAEAYHQGKVSDDMALALLNQHVVIDSQRQLLRQRFGNRFLEVISPRQLARFFQLEHRMDVLVSLSMAKQIPLIE